MLKKIKYYLIIILLLKSILLNAQYINFGLRETQISKAEKETFFESSNYTNTYNLKSRYYFTELIGEKINLSNTFHRINIGFMVNKINQSNTAVFSSIGKSLKLNNTQTSLGYSLMYGIGKIYPFKKLIFRFGIEMSGRYFTPWVIETTIEYFDTNNTKYQTLKFNDTYAGNYIFGTTLLSGIHYNFYKSWSVGIEMGNSLYYGIQKGKEVNTVEDYGSNGNLSSTNTTSVKINSYHWYVSYFRSSISIFYTF